MIGRLLNFYSRATFAKYIFPKEKYELLLDLLTPVAKTFPSENGIISVSQGLQILGGYGYCDEFPIEQFYRDVRIHPIHEGTTGIQGLDLLGRKIVMQGGKAGQLFFQEINALAEQAKIHEELAPYSERLVNAAGTVQNLTLELVQIALNNEPDRFLADSTLYLEMFGYLVIAWQWLLQGLEAQKAIESGDRANFYIGKLHTMKYFFHYELPKLQALAERLSEADGLTLHMSPELFRD